MIRPLLRDYFARRPDVLSAWLFGSEAEGRAHRESDVDIAVLLDRSVRPERRQRDEVQIGIISDLIAVLKRNEVDVVVMNDAPPLLGRHIVRNGVLVHVADPAALHAFSRDVQLRAADLEPFIRRHREQLLEAMQ